MTKSVFNGMGYMVADERASDWGGVDEADILSCGHCGALMRKVGHRDRKGAYHPGWVEEGGQCCLCNQPLCGPEGFDCRARAGLPLDQGGGCNHQERQMERALSDQHRKQQNARILGT